MATYKVLQDIEAEDKLFGPFTLKQFIFGAITIGLLFIGFRILILGIPVFIKLPFIFVMLPFIILFGFLSAPISRDQPNDVWLVARLRFLFKPRTRIWNQDGISELVTITAPKKVEHVYSNNFTQTEVKSRLNALATTLDSRGWVVKNVNANMFAQPGYLNEDSGSSDRLVSTTELPQEVSNVEILASDDILDPASNTTAQHLDQLMKQSAERRKQELASKLSAPQATTQPMPQQQPPQDYWFLNQPAQPTQSLPQDYSTFSAQQVVQPGTTDNAIQAANATAEEEALAHKLAEEKKQASAHANDHMKVLQPLHDREGNIVKQQPAAVSQPAADPKPQAQMRQDPVNPAILGLANNDDLNVATIARQANKINKSDDGEIVISLH